MLQALFSVRLYRARLIPEIKGDSWFATLPVASAEFGLRPRTTY
jgi:hypothetical protein